MTYEKWITLQSAKISADLCRAGAAGFCGDVALYLIPAEDDKWGNLELGTRPPHGATRAINFPGLGHRIGFVPTPHLRGLLWHACRDLPVCGA